MLKKRSPFAVIFFTLITFGIYWLYWYYSINKEIHEHTSEKMNFSPAMALLAQFIPIANFVSHYNTAKRIKTMKNICGDPDTIEPLAAILFSIFLPFGIYTYIIQSGMNNHCYHHGIPNKNTYVFREASIPVRASTAKFCVNCGQSIKSDYRFCDSCGEKI